jgi:hypothetical protein
VFISTSDGKLFISPDPDFKYVDSATSVYIKESVKNKKVLITDFYQLGKEKQIYIDIIAPIMNNKSIPVAAIILRVNPADYLYPLIQSLPILSKTFETLIIRKDGGNILYLNELRHIKNSAMNLRIPLTRTDIPSVQAVYGYTGFFEGTDYCGVAYSIGDAVITTGLNGLIKNMNLAAEKLAGWNESDAKGKKLEEVFHIINEETRLQVENPLKKY